MMYRLFDTSVWINFRNGVQSPETELLDQSLLLDEVCYCPTILQELLQGINSLGFRSLPRFVGGSELIPFITQKRTDNPQTQ
jgi:predicted nucleic acid-binding protein